MTYGDKSTKQKEDSWAWVEIGVPFPNGPVRVMGEQNQYVALWYKNGKPLCGRAWNNGGVVECSFPYGNAELTGKKDLGGQIQILSYETCRDEHDVWRENGFTYRWVKWKNRGADHLQVVRCGDSAPILMEGDDGNMYSGNMDMVTETATISYNGATTTRTTGVGELVTIVRDIREPPQVTSVLEYFDDWVDLRENDSFSRARFPIKALDRALNGPGGKQDVYVALWYKHGAPVCGRVWNERGKIAASFAAFGVEHTKNVGSLQVLVYNPITAGFKLSWQTYKVATTKGSGWFAVRVKDCAPCVITQNGIERLGKVQMSEEKASMGVDGKEVVITGPQVQNFMVLCRDSPVPGATE